MSPKYYITTPIYYANGVPHIGHAYTSFIADVLARTKRMLGYEVKFATGTDENGQKMLQTAEKAGKELRAFLDEMAAAHQATWDALSISYTDFIRTTESRHHAYVQEMLQRTYDAGHIYQGTYEWLYCIGCEGYKKEADLIEREGKLVCPDHLTEPTHIHEKNWFFRLSSFQTALQELYTTRPERAIPLTRFNEIKSFVEQGVEDFSISREGSSVWIPLPFDPSAVTYIWFDALYNYLTVCQGRDESFWQDGEVVHVIGKDIGRFHAIYRPAMLMAVGHKLPDQLIINGHFTIDGQKISKSLGNVLVPEELIEAHGRDALLYYLFSDIKIGNDGDFSQERFLSTKENLLKKGRGNLVSRVFNLATKFEVTQFMYTDADQALLDQALAELGLNDHVLLWSCLHWEIPSMLNTWANNADLMQYTRQRFELVQLGNKLVDMTKPREMAKTDLPGAQHHIALILWLIKNAALLAFPFLLESTEKFKALFAWSHPSWTNLTSDTTSADRSQLIAERQGNVQITAGHLY